MEAVWKLFGGCSETSPWSSMWKIMLDAVELNFRPSRRPQQIEHISLTTVILNCPKERNRFFGGVANQEAQCGGALNGQSRLQTAWDLQYLAMTTTTSGDRPEKKVVVGCWCLTNPT
jgi:hypothetical protein